MPRKPKCKHCKTEFQRFLPLQFVCSPACAFKRAERLREEKQAKEDRADMKARREKIKKKSEWLKEAQVEFNKFIRLRDKNDDCISCGRTNTEVEPSDGWKPGGAWDCGHFLTRGAYPELRFHEDNAHKQCKSCNGGSGKYTRKSHTVAKEYEKRLIQKIGQDRVDWLKGPHEPLNLTIDEIKEIKTKYRAKTKELDNG